MKNYKITDTEGNTHWVHRSIAVAGFIFKKNKKNIFVLANKRGKGTTDFTGLWNCPCGFLDFGETLAQACSREIKEECKLVVDYTKLELYGINDSPGAYLENVTCRYYYILKNTDKSKIGIGVGGEDDEVEEVKWVNILELDKYDWAFGHNKIILKLLDDIILF